MKEIIYLDTEMMNSMLAQLDEGIINSFSLEQSEQASQSKGATSSVTKIPDLKSGLKLSTGIFPGGSIDFGSGISRRDMEGENVNQTVLESQKDILNKAFHDHALNVLLSKLKENGFLKTEEMNLIEGDISFSESLYRFYDFDLIKEASNFEKLKDSFLLEIRDIKLNYNQAKKIVDKINPTAKEREQLEDAKKIINAHDSFKPMETLMEGIFSLSSYSTALLKNLTIIKSGDFLGLLKKENLRESTESLSFRTSQQRKAKFLFRVIGKKDFVHTGYNTPDFKENDLDKIPTMMLDIILQQFKILKTGDILIAPIAIYYE